MGSNPYYFGAPPRTDPAAGLLAALEYKLAEKRQGSTEAYQQGELENSRVRNQYLGAQSKALTDLRDQELNDRLQKEAFAREVSQEADHLGITDPHERVFLGYSIAMHKYAGTKVAADMSKVFMDDHKQQAEARAAAQASGQKANQISNLTTEHNIEPPGQPAGSYKTGVMENLPAAPTVQAQPTPPIQTGLTSQPPIQPSGDMPTLETGGRSFSTESLQDVQTPPGAMQQPLDYLKFLGKTEQKEPRQTEYDIWVSQQPEGADTSLEGYKRAMERISRKPESDKENLRLRTIRQNIENRKIARLDGLEKAFRASQKVDSMTGVANPMSAEELNQRKQQIQNDYEAQLLAAGFEVVPQTDSAPPSHSPAMLPSHGNGSPTARPAITPQQAIEELKRRGRL
jgi:hypothetical protein